MRLTAACLAVLFCASPRLVAQTYWTGDTLAPRLRVSTCALADSVLGPAAKNVLKEIEAASRLAMCSPAEQAP